MAVIDPVNYPTLCDSMKLDVHEGTAPYGLLYTITGTLDIYGNATFSIPNVTCNNYYIAVRHRNSIETWSKLPMLFSVPNMNFDFTH